MVVTRMVAGMVVVGLASLATGCEGDVTFGAPVRCEGLRALKLGTDRETARAEIGEPYRVGRGEARTGSGTPYDELWSYGQISPDMGFHFWDAFDIYFLDGKVVGANAFRSYGDWRNAPGGVRPGAAAFWVNGA